MCGVSVVPTGTGRPNDSATSRPAIALPRRQAPVGVMEERLRGMTYSFAIPIALYDYVVTHNPSAAAKVGRLLSG